MYVCGIVPTIILSQCACLLSLPIGMSTHMVYFYQVVCSADGYILPLFFSGVGGTLFPFFLPISYENLRAIVVLPFVTYQAIFAME